MLAKVRSFGLLGIDAFPVDVEVDISDGHPGYDIVGLPDTAMKESRERVRGAIRNSGLGELGAHLTVNLAPADQKKEGAMLDLAIAIGSLGALQLIPTSIMEDIAFVGELALDGSLRPVRGILSILMEARKMNIKRVIIPKENAKESQYVPEVEVYAFENFQNVLAFLSRQIKFDPVPKNITFIEKGIKSHYDEDFKFVMGQFAARRAMEIAAAGGHNILLIGPPGGGKTMMAKCIPSILPDMTSAEALETTMIHSVAGILDTERGIVINRPFRTPHHTATKIALTGGGKNARPGEISLAHNGVLFLDELPEYKREALEILRQPLEDNKITISRAARTVEYKADFMLVSSMNPCPCGNRGSSTNPCNCTPAKVAAYRAKLSGPLLDRIDLHVEVDNVTYDALSSREEQEDSKTIRERVNRARRIQLERYKDNGIYSNSRINNELLKKHCVLDDTAESILKSAFENLGFSARAYTRILKVARTIADLEGEKDISAVHIAEAVQYRTLDRNTY